MAKAGDLAELRAFVLIPVALDAFLVGMIVAAKRSVAHEISQLVQGVGAGQAAVAAHAG